MAVLILAIVRSETAKIKGFKIKLNKKNILPKKVLAKMRREEERNHKIR